MKTIALNILTAFALTVPLLASEGAHKHATAAAGPNGGRIISSVEPHLEFFVTAERKVEITALTEDLKPAKLSGQIIAVTAGDRSSPTKLEFKEIDGKLVSTNTLPEGNNYPVSVSIKTSEDEKAIYEKFNLNLGKCPTCEYQEYACICGHTHEEDPKKP